MFDNILTVEVQYSDFDVPMLVFCSEFIIPITNKTLINSFIFYFENDLRFKLGALSGNGFRFEWKDEQNDLLNVYFKHNFMGYILCTDLYHCFVEIRQQVTLDD